MAEVLRELEQAAQLIMVFGGYFGFLAIILKLKSDFDVIQCILFANNLQTM